MPSPDLSVWEACVRLAQEAGAPIVIENVRGAMKWVGSARAHLGPYYLWGDVPALLPPGDRFTHRKGLDLSYTAEGKRVLAGPRLWHSKKAARLLWSATTAQIPPELAQHIARCFLA